ncbi:hypothetical protein ACQJBY_007370 [Aegilops geniculata]
MERAMPTMAAESEGATTDDDVHLSPTSVSSGGGGGGGGPPSVRFKILCSFGGRIMPRPSDGALKYIGGDTRVLAVPRSIRFRDLKKKVEEMFKTDVAAIKYQLLSSDDLDVLVSVTCDEDLAHMLDEYDRFEAKRSPSASPRFRVYVFVPHQVSASSVAAAVPAPVSSSRHVSYARNQPHYHPHHHHLQPERERYVASVPGTPDGSPPYPDQPNGIASAGNSPRANIVEQAVFRGGMQRVRSSPNLGGLNAAPLPFHDHGGDSPGGLAGYMSGSPVHPGAGHMFSQGSYNPYRSPQPQYSPAPVPVPHHAGVAGRYDARGGYARGGSYMAAPLAPALRSGRPVSRSGGAPYSEMQTPKKVATIWD